jgi:hypothetical protein
MLSANYTEWHKLTQYADCRFAERHYTGSHYDECCGDVPSMFTYPQTTMDN